MPNAIVASNLTKTYDVKVRDPGIKGALTALARPRYRQVRAVEDVSFSIERGDAVAFLGPNGAGKTTTLKMLTGLLFPSAGGAQVAGYDPWTGGNAFRQRIAFVLGNKQQLLWDLPPEESFRLNRAIYGVSLADYTRRRAELVELLVLGDLIDKPTRQLSLGERMKCELAAALLHQPEVLFLDEPTLGLDLEAQQTIRTFLGEYRRRHGATILLTSHYMADVTALASRVLIINRGRLLYDGELSELVTRIAPIKRIEIVLSEPVPLARLEEYGTVAHYAPPRATLEVPRETATAASTRLLTDLAVADLSIQDPPIEEVIRIAFGETEQNSSGDAHQPRADVRRAPP
ncbi:MAG: ATP-binding cassette domain-containing protein [Gemmatimonadaceae bacterium]